jgi:hypothetical protein
MVLVLVFALPLASPDLNSLPDFSVDLGDGDGGQFLFSISNSSEQQPGQYQILHGRFVEKNSARTLIFLKCSCQLLEKLN